MRQKLHLATSVIDSFKSAVRHSKSAISNRTVTQTPSIKQQRNAKEKIKMRKSATAAYSFGKVSAKKKKAKRSKSEHNKSLP